MLYETILNFEPQDLAVHVDVGSLVHGLCCQSVSNPAISFSTYHR